MEPKFEVKAAAKGFYLSEGISTESRYNTFMYALIENK